MSTTVEANSTKLNEIISKSKDKPVVIDFYASWCGPCQMFSPMFNNVALRNVDKANFVKVNVDDNVDLAEQYSITSIPTIVVLQNGVEVQRKAGVPSYDDLVKMFS